jgi:hypothetical protein
MSLSETGVTTDGADVFYWLQYIAFKAVFYTVLLLIASGYGILRLMLKTDKYYIACMLTFHLSYLFVCFFPN